MSKLLSRKKEREEEKISTTINPSFSLFNITTKQVLNDKNPSYNITIDDNSGNNGNNGNMINELDIADGLKHILISHGFTVEALLNISPTDIAAMLGIDQYIANIIQKAANYYYNAR